MSEVRMNAKVGEIVIRWHKEDEGVDYRAIVDAVSAALKEVCEPRIVDEESEVEYKGWKIRRVPGSEFKGLRGRTKDCYGWIATHIETGHEVSFPPESGDDCRMRIVELQLDTANEAYETLGRFLR
jgi:hypothetical protein